MASLVTRAVNIILHPESEWAVIARAPDSWVRCLSYLAPLALIAPLAYSGRALLDGDSILRTGANSAAALHFALLSVCGGLAAVVLFVTAVTIALYLLAPFFAGRRSFRDAFLLVTFAGTPVWLSGAILLAPLERFPLLVVIILICAMHSMFLMYLGVHHVLGVPRRDAAECSAIVLAAGFLVSTVAGYYAAAAGLLVQL